ncbi:MAG: hypothetical protein VW270_10200 [Candidatus Poseidoniales archaeon]
MAQKDMYIVSYGRPTTFADHYRANPERRQWTSGNAKSWGTNDARQFIDIDVGQMYNYTSEWEGGPSVNDAAVDHAVENCGWWTEKNGPNHHAGNNENKNSAFEIFAKRVITKALYSFGYQPYDSDPRDQASPRETLCIGLSGIFKPRSTNRPYEYDKISVRQVYLQFAVNNGNSVIFAEGKFQTLKTVYNDMVTVLECINSGGSVSSCYQGSAFASATELLQKRMIGSNLVEEYELLSGNYFTSQLSPDATALEYLEEVIAEIGGSLTLVIQALKIFMSRAGALINHFLSTESTSVDALRGQFIAKLTPTAESTFELGRTEWGYNASNYGELIPPDKDRFYIGEVSQFAQRFISFGCLAPNGGLIIAGCDGTAFDTTFGRSHIMDLYDWAPIWAPSGSRRLASNTDDSQGRKVIKRYQHSKKYTISWNTPDTIRDIDIF